jgi:hypothetical protein
MGTEKASGNEYEFSAFSIRRIANRQLVERSA